VLTIGDVYSSSLNGLSSFIIILFSISDHLKEGKVAEFIFVYSVFGFEISKCLSYDIVINKFLNASLL
jgi:hypothetical protein